MNAYVNEDDDEVVDAKVAAHAWLRHEISEANQEVGKGNHGALIENFKVVHEIRLQWLEMHEENYHA